MNLKKIAASILMGCFAATSMAFATYHKQPGHPRVNQVNRRFGKWQQNRMNKGLKNGTLGPKEYNKLEKERSRMKSEEHFMRSQDKGHLTKADQRALNQSENKMSRQIYRYKHNDPKHNK